MSTVKSKKLQVGTDATSSNNFTIYQPATPDGTLRIGVGNADSPTEVGRFTSAGYKPATAPNFSVYKDNGDQTTSNGVFTKITFNSTAEWDLTSDYDTTNHRFQPSVAGYYQINGSFSTETLTAPGRHIISLFKNGSEYRRGNDIIVGGYSAVISIIVYMNGSTDYVELYAWQNASSGGGIRGDADGEIYTYFQGYLVQQA